MSLLQVTDFFTVSVVLYIVMLISNISAFLFIETAGRRPLLLWGMILLTLIELVRRSGSSVHCTTYTNLIS
jgi:hypothetical protein